MKRISLLTYRNEVFKQRPAAASNGLDLDLDRGRRLMAVCVCLCVFVDIIVIENVMKIAILAQSGLCRPPGSRLDFGNEGKWSAYSDSSSKTGLEILVKHTILEKKAFLAPPPY